MGSRFETPSGREKRHLRTSSSSKGNHMLMRPRRQVPKISAKMPSQLEHAMETVMFTFHKFAGEKNYLLKEDLRQLMEKEVPGYMENQKDPMAIDRIMKNLEECRDGKISFEGYLSLFAGLTNGCNEYYVKNMKPTGKKY